MIGRSKLISPPNAYHKRKKFLAHMFGYDAFGNVRFSQGMGAGGAGGDFRFQGQWLESATGIYHFRARDYDARTGTFLSRDPVDPNEQQPEALNPYQAMYNNPYVYSDPSGRITLGDLIASRKVQDILQGIQKYSLQQGKQYLLDQAKGVAGDVLLSIMKQLVPFTGFQNVLNLGRNLDAGIEFENVIRGAVCNVISESFPQFKEHLWLQTRVSVKGNPIDDGWVCGSAFPKNENEWFREQNLFGNRPDFLIKDGGPRTTDKNPKAYLIRDVKLAGKTVLSSSYKDQWKAIMNYASSKNGHQYQPVALFVALYSPTQAEYKKIKKRASSYGVDPVIAPILSRAK